ncbi:MAG TPA: hypothetical protein PLM53_08625 [Spirochaetota bacterium]|nr:hypothetical protein [Spirochaetota bacterium]HPC42194.1 hypothetical protein [Spirochaetota bacterium]HPL16598.1 hypothetical protein [Spirochaetota bacterium]HQF08236.1 hypothetical protein [Spirochaetota bacterium]HQH97149.1 hypothetical protein [Spirochaetota bacterium]
MIKYFLLSCLAVTVMLWTASSASALGIGAYIDAAGGETYRSVKSKSFDSTGGKLTGYGFRAGLIFETCAACDSDFSYRLKLGGGMSWADLQSKTDYNGFYMSHTFAFAAVKNDYVKFWIGPQIGFSYRRGSSDRYFIGTDMVSSLYYIATVPTPNLVNFGIFKERNKYSIYGVDGGLSFGVNLNLGDYVTLGLEAGVKYGYNIGSQDRELYYTGNPFIPYNRFKSDRLTEHGIEGYGSFAFMFRFVDTYQE